jgi:hypothetical protein
MSKSISEGANEPAKGNGDFSNVIKSITIALQNKLSIQTAQNAKK